MEQLSPKLDWKKSQCPLRLSLREAWNVTCNAGPLDVSGNYELLSAQGKMQVTLPQ